MPWQGFEARFRCLRPCAAAWLFLAILWLTVAANSASARLSIAGRRLVDGHGGTVILRGGAYEYSPSSPALSQSDWLNMQQLGWNSIRLGANWSFIEPSPGVYDSTYLDGVASIARAAMVHGLYVILDMHQDLWGPPFGDGAPEWTIQPRCAPLAPVNPGAATGAWQANYLAPWTVCQFTSFWQDATLQAHFTGAWEQVIRRLAGSSRLAGYDLFNEPFQGMHPPAEFELNVLYPFYRRVGQALHEIDPGGLVFEEPPNAKNAHLPTVPTPDPGPGAIYAPHVYGLWDATEAISPPPPLVRENMSYSELECRVMGVPLWFGEFGMRRGAPGAESTLTEMYDLADKMLAGTNYWVYDRGDYGAQDADGKLDPVRARTLSRTYPMRTAGALNSFSFDPATNRFTMSWVARAHSGATLIYVPAVRYAHGLTIRTDPTVRWQRLAQSQLLRVTAAPGPHELTITTSP